MTRPSSSASSERTSRRPRTKASTEHYRIAWPNPITSETIHIRITHTRDYLAKGQSHIEIECIKPKGATLPITESGYRSHFIDALELVNSGGPVTFVTAWIEREAKSKAWRAAETARAQGDLFQWADAKRAVTGRKSTPATSRPVAASPKPDDRRTLDRPSRHARSKTRQPLPGP